MIKKDPALTGYPKYLDAAVDSKNNIHIIYTLYQNELKMWKLIHQYFDNKWHWCVIDSGIEGTKNKAVIGIDGKDNVNFVYQILIDSTYQLIHTSENSNKEVTQLTDTIHDNQEPNIIFDAKDNLHLVWLGSDGLNTRVNHKLFKHEKWPEGGWKKTYFLSDKGHNVYSPALLARGSRIIALWQQHNGIHCRLSENCGETWLPQEKIKAFKDFINYTLSKLDVTTGEYELIQSLSSTGPQLSLLAATALANPNSIDAEVPADIGSLLPQIQIYKSSSASKALTRTIKHMLFIHKDINLSNRLMEKTIENQTKQINELKQIIKEQETKIINQTRELNWFKSRISYYKSQNEALHDNIKKLKHRNYELEKTLNKSKNHKLHPNIQQNTNTKN